MVPSIGASMAPKKHLLYLDSLDSILDLEQPALGAEGVDAPIVLGAGEEHCLSREGDKEKELRERKERGSFSFFSPFELSKTRNEEERKKAASPDRSHNSLSSWPRTFLQGASSSSKFRASRTNPQKPARSCLRKARTLVMLHRVGLRATREGGRRGRAVLVTCAFDDSARDARI